MPSFTDALLALPHASEGAAPRPGPHAVLGLGEGALAAELLFPLIGRRLSAQGTQFLLASGDWDAAAQDYASMAEVSGAQLVRLGDRLADAVTPDRESPSALVRRGPLSTYHYAQWVAHAAGFSEEAREADRLLADLAARCAPDVDENPARALAWSLWGRVPLLLAAQGEDVLPRAWQQLLARIGKSLAVPVAHEPLYILTGAFEARHENGDGRVALILGDEDEELTLAREVLETRVDEVIHVPYPEGVGGYAGNLALWYFGLWVATYLAERYGQPPEDSAALRAVFAGLDGRGQELN